MFNDYFFLDADFFLAACAFLIFADCAFFMAGVGLFFSGIFFLGFAMKISHLTCTMWPSIWSSTVACLGSSIMSLPLLLTCAPCLLTNHVTVSRRPFLRLPASLSNHHFPPTSCVRNNTNWCLSRISIRKNHPWPPLPGCFLCVGLDDFAIVTFDVTIFFLLLVF